MAYSVIISKDIQRQLKQLPGHIKPLVKTILLSLPDEPRPQQAKQLDAHPNYYRIWIGANYRLVWLVIDGDKLIEIQYVGPKTPDLYEFLGLSHPTDEHH